MGLGEEEPPWPPPARSTAENRLSAQEVRTYMEDHAATELGAACGCFCAPVEMRPDKTPVDLVANLELLLAAPHLPQDRENGLPRASLTVTEIDGMRYCLEPEAYHPEDRSLDLCLAIVPSSTTFNINLPKKVILDDGEEAVDSIHIHRSGLGDDNIYSVTDYWTQVCPCMNAHPLALVLSISFKSSLFPQGMSFGNHLFIIDLKPPPGGKIRGASIYVPLSRYRKFSDIKILRPLWTEGNSKERRQVIERLFKALSLPECLVTELQRLMAYDGPTRQRYAGLLDELKARGL